MRESANDRLIPACAGKTSVETSAIASMKAHPRVCGENRRSEMFRWLTPGSSPRVRGKLRAAKSVVNDAGLIPACAGKTILADLSHRRIGAHPRVCGENKRK